MESSVVYPAWINFGRTAVKACSPTLSSLNSSPFALYALEPHEDTPRQAPQEEALLLVQTLQRQVPPLVEDQAVAQAQ